MRHKAQWRRARRRGWATVALLTICLATSCGRGNRESSPLRRWNLTSAPLLELWQTAAMPQTGAVQREADGYMLKAGAPMTGVMFPGWEQEGLPLTDYVVTYEAMRVSGGDFFGSLTFPVGSVKQCVTFVLGGWGGSQVGISNLDGQDASMNSTGSSHVFENGKWYRVKIAVRQESLEVWLEDRPLVNVDIVGRQLDLRHGDIDRCAPFGFATYHTTGRVRAVVVEKL